MCSACGFPAAPGHWTDAGAQTPGDRLRLRFARLGAVNRLLAPYGLKAWDDGATPGLQLFAPGGQRELVSDLAALWAALPDLQVVVAVGTPALQGVMRLMTIDETARVVPALGAPHPSPRNAHARAEAFNRLRVALERAQEIATS